jgi:hypothetical protein
MEQVTGSASRSGDTDGPVYHWAWIAGHAREVAPDLASFWPQWLRGSLNV